MNPSGKRLGIIHGMHSYFDSPINLMKNPITFFLLPLTFLFGHNLSAALNYQNFTDVQGRTIQAHVWKVVGNEVFLEFRDGRKFRVSTQVFSPQSQALIQQLAQPPAPAPAPSGIPFGGSSPAPVPPPVATPPTQPPAVPTATAVPFATSTPSVSAPPPAVSTTPAFPPSGAPAAAPTSSVANIDISSALLPNASIICKVDAAKIQNSPFGQTLISQLKPPTPPGAPAGAGPGIPFGLSEKDIQAIAFSVTNLDKINVAQVKQAGPSAMKNLPPEIQFVFAVSLAKPIPYDEAKAEMMKDPNPPVFTDYAGALLGTPPPGTEDIPDNFCVCLKNQGAGSIFFMGEVNTVKSILDGQSQPAAGGLANEDFALSVSIPPTLMQQLIPQEAASGPPNPLTPFLPSLQQLNQISLGLSFNQAANIKLSAGFTNASMAEGLAGLLKGMIGVAASQPDTPALLKQIAITNQANQVDAVLSIQAEDAMGLAQMAMMGGPGGGDPDMAGPGGAFPPSGDAPFPPPGAGVSAPGTPPPTSGVPFTVESSNSPAAPTPAPSPSTGGVDPFAN